MSSIATTAATRASGAAVAPKSVAICATAPTQATQSPDGAHSRLDAASLVQRRPATLETTSRTTNHCSTCTLTNGACSVDEATTIQPNATQVQLTAALVVDERAAQSSRSAAPTAAEMGS